AQYRPGRERRHRQLREEYTVRLLFISLLLASACALGAELRLPVYPNAELQRPAQQQTVDEYVLPMGPYQRAAGEWRLEGSERLTGVLQRNTWRFPDGHSLAEVQRFWRNQLQP